MVALYSETLLDHFRHPRNYGDLPAADISYESFNPLCGDRIRIAVKLNDTIVQEVRFKGDACAISDDHLIAALESDIKPRPPPVRPPSP